MLAPRRGDGMPFQLPLRGLQKKNDARRVAIFHGLAPRGWSAGAPSEVRTRSGPGLRQGKAGLEERLAEALMSQ